MTSIPKLLDIARHHLAVPRAAREHARRPRTGYPAQASVQPRNHEKLTVPERVDDGAAAVPERR